MTHVQRTFTVNQPIETVVGYLTDFAHAESWDPGTVSCTQTSTGDVRVGTTWHNVSEILGRQTELSYELTYADPHRLTFVGKNKTATSTDDMTFEAIGDADLDHLLRNRHPERAGQARRAAHETRVQETRPADSRPHDQDPRGTGAAGVS